MISLSVGVTAILIITAVFILKLTLPKQPDSLETQMIDSSSNSIEQSSASVISRESGIWNLPIPFINPLYRQKEYLNILVENNQVTSIDYIDGDFTQQYRTVSGQTWIMEVPVEPEELTTLDGLFSYMQEINGSFYYTKSSTKVCYIEQDDGTKWWATAVPESDFYRLTVVKETILEPNKPIEITTSDYPDHEFRFSSYQTGKKFQSLELSFMEANVTLLGMNNSYQGRSNRRFDYNRLFESVMGNHYILDDISQDIGVTEWVVSWYEDQDPKKISLSLTETVSLAGITKDSMFDSSLTQLPQAPIPSGEEPGFLRVHGVPAGSIHVELPDGISLVHPDFNSTSLQGDVTPEGDTVFWLPGGYYNLVFGPEGEDAVTKYYSRLVPVHPGKTTRYEIPESWQSVFAQLSNHMINEETGIVLTATRDFTDTAEIDFTLIEKSNENRVPTLADTQITEGGMETRLLSIDRIEVPSSIVLLLDSSGSMKGQMEQTLATAKQFIDNLPDDTWIQVVDFDTTVNPLPGNTKEEALKQLTDIKANGATALHDSIIESLLLLEDKQRPALMVFTDGVDSNANDTGPGSQATREELLEAVTTAKIPLYTIGFGPKHDNSTLLALASVTGGRYYPAENQDALSKVFEAIATKLGSAFRATYERPEKAAPADTPVISFMLDISGSMNTNPEVDGCGYRLDKMKNLFHDFLLQIPEDSVVQLSSFSGEVWVNQAMTTDKAQVLQALGSLREESTTEIPLALETAIASIKPIPSTRKVLIFLTDAALPNGQEDEDFNALLEELGTMDMDVLWVGLGVEDAEEAFIYAAEQTGGQYIISEDSNQLQDAFDSLMNNVYNKKNNNKTSVSLQISKPSDESGEVAVYRAAKVVDFAMRDNAEQTYTINTVNASIVKESYASLYHSKASQTMYGSDIPRQDVMISRQIPMKASGKNQMMEMDVHEATSLSRFRGIDAPNGMQILALNITLKNKAGKDIPYRIPSMESHFWFNLNNEGLYPASIVTWLAEEPLVEPGQSGIELSPEETRTGTLFFVVPDEPMKDGALSFYDTNNGHIVLSLAGKVTLGDKALSRLPKEAVGKLSDTFTFQVNSLTDMKELAENTLDNDQMYRVVEGTFTSKVQAILDIDPFERISLRISSESGPFRFLPDPLTKWIPYGFGQRLMLAPASDNRVRMAFQIPESLQNQNADIVMDLADADFILRVKEAGSDGTGHNDHGYDNIEEINKDKMNKDKMNKNYHDIGYTLKVNHLNTIEDALGSYGTYLVADMTFSDMKDQLATSGFQELFYLVRDDVDTNTNTDTENNGLATAAMTESKGLGNFASGNGNLPDGILVPDSNTDELLTGLASDFVLLDGETRRGLLLFRLPEYWADFGWSLRYQSGDGSTAVNQDKNSEDLNNLNIPISTLDYPYPEYLVLRQESNEPELEQFESEIYEKLPEAQNRFQNTLKNKTPVPVTNVLLKPGEAQTIPVPSIVVSGQQKMQSVHSMDDALQFLTSVRWLPADYSAPDARYSPEAVLTQGWGTENDIADLAMALVSRAGEIPERRTVMVTPEGIRALEKLCGLSECKLDSIPLITWKENGERHLLVIPFMQELDQLTGKVYLSGNVLDEPTPLHAEITITLDAIPTDKNLQSQAADASDALAGGGEAERSTESIPLISRAYPLSILSNDCFDVGYTIVGKKEGDLITCVLDGPKGREMGENPVDTGMYTITGVRLGIFTPNGYRETVYTLRKGESITGLFHTIAINLPDLPETAATQLDEAAAQIYSTVNLSKTSVESSKNSDSPVSEMKPDAISAMKWFNRSTIYRFIMMQTQTERDLGKELSTITGRTSTERCIVVTNRRKNTSSPFVTGIDLLQQKTDLLSGSSEAKNAFAIASGLMASVLEGDSLPGNGMDFMEIWAECPANTQFLMTYGSLEDRTETVEHMKTTGYPEFLVEKVENSDKVLMFPNKPSMIDGEQRWAWLEIDPDTYDVISVLDTGEHGGTVSYSIQIAPEFNNYRDYTVGAFVGVQTAVWAVVDFSLELDDYKEILKNAKLLCKGILTQMKKFSAGTGAVKGEFGLGPVKYKTSPTLDGWNVNVGQNVVGFNSGFQAGVDYYFSQTGE